MRDYQDFSNQSNFWCNQCGGYAVVVHDYDRGEILCKDCGMIMEEKISCQGKEYASQSLDESYRRSRTRGPNSTAFLDYGVSSEISDRPYSHESTSFIPGGFAKSSNSPKATASNKEGESRQSPPSLYNSIWKMKKLDFMTKTKSPKARSLNRSFQFLGRLRDRLSLPQHAVERSAYIYRKSIDAGLSRGRPTECLVCGCVFVACKESEIPYTSREISDKLMANKKVVLRIIRDIHEKVGISLSLVNPSQYISKIANKLGLDEITMRKSIHVLKIAYDNEMVEGKDPSCVAAACVFIGCRNRMKHVTLDNISKQSHVSHVSIRERLKELQPAMVQTEFSF